MISCRNKRWDIQETIKKGKKKKNIQEKEENIKQTKKTEQKKKIVA
jgi:hypothetical protein